MAAICSLFYYIYIMKTIVLSICLLFSINSFSQKVSYKDLIGTRWLIQEDSANFTTYTFQDSSHFYFHGRNGDIAEAYVLDYSLDTSYCQTLMYVKEYKTPYSKLGGFYCYLKIDNDILKLKIIDKKKKPKDKNSIEYVSTIALMKRVENIDN